MQTARLIAACLPAVLLNAACDSTGPSAVPLASLPLQWSGATRQTLSGIRIYAGYTTNSQPPVLRLLFVDTLPVTRHDIGRHVALTQGSPEFAAVEALLTNGVDDMLQVGFVAGTAGNGGGGTTSRRESVYLEDRIDGSTPPDLKGLLIERITVEINVASFESPGRDPDGDGLGTDYTVRGRIVFEGQP